MPSTFKDYYHILQVHHDASPDVIKAAYRKLCTLYHPDTSHNENEMSRMIDINEAYHTLSDSDKRAAYHRQWLEHFTNRNKHVYSVVHPPYGTQHDSAQNVLDVFFHALYTKNWTSAYSCLAIEDQMRVTMGQFQAWREAVSDCFEMQDYRIQKYRSYNHCRIGEVVYEQVAEYAVIINDLDLQTSKVSQSTTHKYAVFDGTSWKVCLGLKSVKHATLKFKLMAQRRKNYDPVALYQSAVAKHDPLTGLLSERGFYDEAFKEVERYKRYNNPFSLIAFQVNCKDNTREIPCLCHCASIIKASSRITDIVARFGNNQIICLLAETTESQAVLAAQKFVANIKQRQTEEFTLNAGVIQFKGMNAIEDAVFAACSDASRRGNSIFINQREGGF